jgi:hypothetical protein
MRNLTVLETRAHERDGGLMKFARREGISKSEIYRANAGERVSERTRKAIQDAFDGIALAELQRPILSVVDELADALKAPVA